MHRRTAGILLITACLEAGLSRVLRGQEPRWPDERTAGPFICHADFSLAESATLLGELANLQRDLETTLELKTAQEPVHLFLFSAKPTYQEYMKQYFPRVPNRRALFIKGRGPGMVFAYRGTDFEIDVRHESTHALLHTAVTQLPLWLDEGLAEYFEMPREARIGGSSHHSVISALAELGKPPRLEALEGVRDLNDMGNDEYRDAWAWVHFCLHGPPEAGDELRRFLNDLAARTDTATFSRRLRQRIPDLNGKIIRHFRTLKSVAILSDNGPR